MEDNRRLRIRIDPPAPRPRPAKLGQSDAYSQLKRLATASPFHRDEIVDFVQEQPEIAERLLRVVNSPQYGLRAPVSDVRHAIGLLGPSGLLTFTEPFVNSRLQNVNERNRVARL